ncbi:MAG: bifunctional demethylmenaquinone methyltransferase/2-methoxy-6-polyprenyl-1,4-benzoquinol methylase UbiE [Pseudomonadota bacterium]
MEEKAQSHQCDTVPFGFDDIASEDKTNRVRDLFSGVADKYDIMNDVMSLGIHRLWKEQFVTLLDPKPYRSYIDVAGGTGDIALKIADRRETGQDIVILDMTYDMLEKGKTRKHPHNQDIQRICGNAEQLPFAACSFDGYTISYGIRNVTHIEKALSEAYRALKPGGKFMCLEFTMPDHGAFRKLYDLYSFHILPKMGKIISKDEDAYRYLAESIRRFPRADRFKTMIEQAGFQNTSYRILSQGITAIHIGYKICL